MERGGHRGGDRASAPCPQRWPPSPQAWPRARRPRRRPRPGSQPRVRESGRPVRMKEFAAGSKAKTVQLADFKWFVCPLDAPLEKLPPPSQGVCGGRGQTGPPRPHPSHLLAPGSGGRAERLSHGHHCACGLPEACPALTGVRGGLSAPGDVLDGESQLRQARLRGPAEAAPDQRVRRHRCASLASPVPPHLGPPALILPCNLLALFTAHLLRGVSPVSHSTVTRF